MKQTGSIALAACSAVFGVAALSVAAIMSKPATLMAPSDFYAARTLIETRAHADLEACRDAGEARGACEALVRADERSRKGRLEAQYLGTVRAARNARFENVRGEFDIAVAQCKLEGEKSTEDCIHDAREQKSRLLAEAESSS
jgi:hypothetical protein